MKSYSLFKSQISSFREYLTLLKLSKYYKDPKARLFVFALLLLLGYKFYKAVNNKSPDRSSHRKQIARAETEGVTAKRDVETHVRAPESTQIMAIARHIKSMQGSVRTTAIHSIEDKAEPLSSAGNREVSVAKVVAGNDVITSTAPIHIEDTRNAPHAARVDTKGAVVTNGGQLTAIALTVDSQVLKQKISDLNKRVDIFQELKNLQSTAHAFIQKLNKISEPEEEKQRILFASSQQDTHQKVMLGRYYLYGLKEGGNKEQGKELLREARKQPDVTLASLYATALCYEEGIGVDKNLEMAVAICRFLAALGYAPAQSNLGFFYEKGKGGLDQSYEEAEKCYLAAAGQGYACAQNYLGLLYKSKGRDREAFKWMVQAGSQGHPRALKHLSTPPWVDIGKKLKREREINDALSACATFLQGIRLENPRLVKIPTPIVHHIFHFVHPPLSTKEMPVFLTKVKQLAYPMRQSTMLR